MTDELPIGSWDDVALVVYTSQFELMEWDEADGIPTWCRDMGLASIGLWARNGDTEVPLVNIAPHGIINSFSTAHSRNTDSEPVSNVFVDMMAKPGNATQAQHEQLPPSEQLLISLLRENLYTQGMPIPEVAGVIEWCKEQTND